MNEREGIIDFSIDYGLPGSKGYSYQRPFDYFNFQAAVSTANGIESVFTRGLLVGEPYEVGDTYRAVWGLYGSYDYLAPRPSASRPPRSRSAARRNGRSRIG